MNELNGKTQQLTTLEYNNKMLKDELNSYSNLNNNEQKFEIPKEWKNEIDNIQLNYKNELEKEKEKYNIYIFRMNKKCEEYIVKLHQAEDEWNKIESELANEKNDQLETLKELKKTKTEVF